MNESHNRRAHSDILIFRTVLANQKFYTYLMDPFVVCFFTLRPSRPWSLYHDNSSYIRTKTNPKTDSPNKTKNFACFFVFAFSIRKAKTKCHTKEHKSSPNNKFQFLDNSDRRCLFTDNIPLANWVGPCFAANKWYNNNNNRAIIFGVSYVFMYSRPCSEDVFVSSILRQIMHTHRSKK